MLISLHKNATTTPATREAIQNATGSDYELARQFGVCRDTIRKWRRRDTVLDGSHTAHRLQTTLNAGQEELVIYLRTQLLLPLDDLLAVVREFIEPEMSRSALDRLLRRRGHSRLPAPETELKDFLCAKNEHCCNGNQGRTWHSAERKEHCQDERPPRTVKGARPNKSKHQHSDD